MTHLKMIQYTDKSIRLYGNTKDYKDLILSIGGKYNPKLKSSGETGDEGGGFIFSIKKENEVKMFIEKINSGEEIPKKKKESSISEDIVSIKHLQDEVIRLSKELEDVRKKIDSM